MKPRIFLVGLGLIILILASAVLLNRDLAIGQGSQGDPATDMSDKLDQLLANQNKIIDRLDSLTDFLSHEIRVRCTS